MAMNPPPPGEEPDEDFFDKLVEDKFQGVGTSSEFVKGSDSDKEKAFVNPSTDDVGGEGLLDSKAGAGDVAMASLDAHPEESSSSGSFPFSGGTESKNTANESEVSDSTANTNSGSGGVKEVQWSLFNTETAENGSHGLGSYSDFFNDLGESAENFPGAEEDKMNGEVKAISVDGECSTKDWESSVHHGQHQETRDNGMTVQQNVIGQDLSSSQDWESLYPGWRYDHSSEQWYQVGGFDMTGRNQMALDNYTAVGPVVSDGNHEFSYLQQTAHSILQTLTESGTTENISNWNQGSQVNNGCPEHMIFDPQYPGWYYDTIAQEWRSLETYAVSDQTLIQNHNGQIQTVFSPTGTSSQSKGSGVNTDYLQSSNCGSQPQDYGNQEEHSCWSGSNNNQPTQNHVHNQGSQGYGSQGQAYGSQCQNYWPGSNYNLPNQNGYVSSGTHSQVTDTKVHGQGGKSDNNVSQDFGGHIQDSRWGGSFGNNSWQQNSSISNLCGNQQMENAHCSKNSILNPEGQLNSFNSSRALHVCNEENEGHIDTIRTGLQSPVPGRNFSQKFNQAKPEPNETKHVLDSQYSGQRFMDFSEQPTHGGHQSNYAPSIGRSSAGRPAHPLVTFGFGGKFIVMKDNNSLCNSSPYENQELLSRSVSILNLMEVCTEKIDFPNIRVGASSYFQSLCQQSFPGPLVGGNVGSKELHKWIDEMIANFESLRTDYKKGEVLRLLLSLLKIACQYYGKLRSPFGSDTSRENDIPESAVAKLFASAKRNGAETRQNGSLAHRMQKSPSENKIRVTASEVQNLLVSGRKKEALHCAQEGHLWGPALVLASQLGDQFYVDTVKQMALRELIPGSPLRTLCLLIAGKPADVFSAEPPTDNGLPGALHFSPQPAQFGANDMLDEWEENLAVITANRTKDDELVLLHLGDCLWKERSEITAAHICYLVAETNFESYSDSARLCLIGADHWKYPRSYASPEAIQRTELYEYAKVLGNSQFMLLPFQPYKLIYAYMLAEVGKVSDSLKYCQAVIKSLKTSRAPEVEIWKQFASSLDERIRIHQQGGYTSNSAPKKLVGKLLNFFDSTTHRVVRGLPPAVPSTSKSSPKGNEKCHQQVGSRVSTSQSTMAMSSLMPSGTTEPISEQKTDSNRRIMHNRSVSEPNIGLDPREVGFSKDEASSNAQGKLSSRFVRFGFGSQLLQKTVGLVLKPRGDRQAKLGETNKFYYHEKLKRWVEEGTEPLAEEAALPPPPPTLTFQNGMSNFSASKNDGFSPSGSPGSKSSPPSESSSGMPPLPSGQSHFSARGKLGVRSRYVDTFNKGGGSTTNLCLTPSVQSIKPAVSSNAKFFVPTPATSTPQTFDPSQESAQKTGTNNKVRSTTSTNASFHSPSLSSSSSMGNFLTNSAVKNNYGPFSSRSRRTSSWAGSFDETFSPDMGEVKPLGEVLGLSPSTFMSSDPSLMPSPTNGGDLSGDLHEVNF